MSKSYIDIVIRDNKSSRGDCRNTNLERELEPSREDSFLLKRKVGKRRVIKRYSFKNVNETFNCNSIITVNKHYLLTQNATTAAN